jgi:NAD(P)-dependent dehydrogenase (short-subunit alcohol dehydrogenase family)
MIFANDALRGKRILITGASSGIGRAAAILFAECGASLILCGRDEARLSETHDALAGAGHRVASADLSSLDVAHDLLVTQTRDEGPLSGVFHAAGVVSLRLAKLYNQDHVDAVVGATINGALGISKACAKRKVLDDDGALVFMSSVAGVRGRAGMGTYATAKAAIGGLTRALAAELAPRRVRVNEIVAGAVETPMHAGIVKNLDESSEDAYRELHLLGFGQPDDIATMATFLLSDAARWITGSSIAVDGGYTAA